VEEANCAHAQRALDALIQRRTRLEDERGTIAGPDARGVAEREARLDARRDALDTLQQDVSAAQGRLPAAQAALREAMETERGVQRRLTELRAQRNALVQLQAKVASQGELGDWLARHGHQDLAPLWRSLKVEEGWEAAIEAALRERLAALTTEAGNAGLAADMLDTPPPSSLALGFADAQRGAPHALVVAPEGCAPLVARVAADAGFAPLLADWLHGWFAVDRLDDWLPRRGQLARGVVLVSRAGQALSCDALVHFVPDSRTKGVIERQREIDTLGTRQQALEDEARLAHDALLNAEAVAAGLQDSIDARRHEAQAAQAALHADEVEVLKLGQELARAEERRTRIESDLADLLHQEAGERERQTRAELEYNRASELADLQRVQLDSAAEVLREREEALRSMRTLEQSLARELQEAHFSARECEGKLEDNARNTQLATEQLENITTERVSREAELEATDAGRSHDALQSTLETRARRESALAARRDALETAAATLRETEELRLRTEHEAAPVRERVAELRLAVQAAELAVAQFEERLKEANADEEKLAPLLADAPKEATIQREVARLARELGELGAVNLAAVEELATAAERKGYLDAQNDDLFQAIETLEDAIRRIDRETREQLQATYNTVNGHFASMFPQLFGGGRAELVLTGEEILDAGIQIVAQPPGKKNASIHLLSGGEKALTAIALVFAMFLLNPAPFCMLDEVDAPLDDTNTGRYSQMVKRMSSQTQFIFISHSKITMEVAQQLVGVTMQEQGVSRVVEVDIEEALRLAEPAAA
jgi:chromosome segregation protein